jgi:coenzyme PQQ precursor peptide PqqA
VLKVSNHELRSYVQPGEDYAMKWKTPRIVEIAVGMEINCYACAEIETYPTLPAPPAVEDWIRP